MEYPFMVKSVANRPNGVKRTGGVGYPVKDRIMYLLLAGLFMVFAPCAGQVDLSVRTGTDSLYFHVSGGLITEFSCHFTYAQGSGAISPYLGNNAAELEKLDRFIRQALSHPTLFISRIRLTGYSSIEGSYARNELLAQERVAGLYVYLRDHYPTLYRYPYDRAWGAEDWDGLSRLVKESPLREREEILKIIRTVPVYDTREALLAKLDGGYPWLFMEREVFPQLRRVEVRIEFSTTEIHKPTASPQPSPKERGF
jgi:hypothetical protein